MSATAFAAAADGDDDALAALVHAYHDRVYRVGTRACRDRADADDAVQEAFAKLARRPDVVAHPGALAWLMTVVRRACLRLLRPFARERRVLGERADADEVPADAIDPEQALSRWQLVRDVHAAIAALAPDLRAVLVLRELEGLAGDDTARALGISVAAMKSRLHRARAALRARLAEMQADDRASRA